MHEHSLGSKSSIALDHRRLFPFQMEKRVQYRMQLTISTGKLQKMYGRPS